MRRVKGRVGALFLFDGPYVWVEGRDGCVRYDSRAGTWQAPKSPQRREPVRLIGLIDGKLYGNVFTTRNILRIEPVSGCIEAIAHLGNLWREMNAEERAQTDDSDNVLNGIAYDAKTARFYVTGKRWKSIFVGRFAEAGR